MNGITDGLTSRSAPIARSNTYNDVRPYIEHMWATDPKKCREIFTDMFPRGVDNKGATQSEEDIFIRRFFDHPTFQSQSPRFLKQVLYNIACYNDERVRDAAELWMNNEKLLEDTPSMKHILQAQTLRAIFGEADMCIHHNDEMLLHRMMLYIQYRISSIFRLQRIEAAVAGASSPHNGHEADGQAASSSFHAVSNDVVANGAARNTEALVDGAAKLGGNPATSHAQDGHVKQAANTLDVIEEDLGSSAVDIGSVSTGAIHSFPSGLHSCPEHSNIGHDPRVIVSGPVINGSTTMSQVRRSSNVSNSSRGSGTKRDRISNDHTQESGIGRGKSSAGRGHTVPRGRGASRGAYNGRQPSIAFQNQAAMGPNFDVSQQENQPAYFFGRAPVQNVDFPNTVARSCAPEGGGIHGSSVQHDRHNGPMRYSQAGPPTVFTGNTFNLRGPGYPLGGNVYAGPTAGSMRGLQETVAITGLSTSPTSTPIPAVLQRVAPSLSCDQIFVEWNPHVTYVTLSPHGAQLLLRAGSTLMNGAEIRFSRPGQHMRGVPEPTYGRMPIPPPAQLSPHTPEFDPNSYNRRMPQSSAAHSSRPPQSRNWTVKNAAGQSIPEATLGGDARLAPPRSDETNPYAGFIHCDERVADGGISIEASPLEHMSKEPEAKKRVTKPKTRRQVISTAEEDTEETVSVPENAGESQPHAANRETLAKLHIETQEKDSDHAPSHINPDPVPEQAPSSVAPTVPPEAKITVEDISTTYTAASPKDRPASPDLKPASSILVSKRASIGKLTENRVPNLPISPQMPNLGQKKTKDSAQQMPRPSSLPAHRAASAPDEPVQLSLSEGERHSRTQTAETIYSQPAIAPLENQTSPIEQRQMASRRSTSRMSLLQDVPADDIDDSFRTAAESPTQDDEDTVPGAQFEKRIDSLTMPPSESLSAQDGIAQDTPASIDSKSARPDTKNTATEEVETPTSEAKQPHLDDVGSTEPIETVKESVIEESPGLSGLELKQRTAALKSSPKQTESLSPFAKSAQSKKQDKKVKQKSKAKSRQSSKLHHCEGSEDSRSKRGSEATASSSTTHGSVDEHNTATQAHNSNLDAIVEKISDFALDKSKMKPKTSILKSLPARLKSALTGTSAEPSDGQADVIRSDVKRGKQAESAKNSPSQQVFASKDDNGGKTSKQHPTSDHDASEAAAPAHNSQTPATTTTVDKALRPNTSVTADTGSGQYQVPESTLTAPTDSNIANQGAADAEDANSSVTWSPTTPLSPRPTSSGPSTPTIKLPTAGPSHLVEAPKNGPGGKKKSKKSKKGKKKVEDTEKELVVKTDGEVSETSTTVSPVQKHRAKTLILNAEKRKRKTSTELMNERVKESQFKFAEIEHKEKMVRLRKQNDFAGMEAAEAVWAEREREHQNLTWPWMALLANLSNKIADAESS